MQKYSTNYASWVFWLLPNLLLLSLLFFVAYKGATYDKKYAMDLTGHGLILLSIGGGCVVGWEIITLFDYLIKGTNGDIYLSRTELRLPTKGGFEILNFKDLTSVEFVSPRYGGKSVTSHVSHCKLTFKQKTVILTSFTIKNEDIAKHLTIPSASMRNRERTYFELIH